MDSINNWRYSKLNSGIVKLLLLSFGVRMSNQLLESVSNEKKISKNYYYYDSPNASELSKKYRLPSEILLPDEVESSFYINRYSPLEIVEAKKDHLQLLYNDNIISDLQFNYGPQFFDIKLSDGTFGKQHASMYGRNILGLFLSGYCHYPAKSLGCKFCSIRSTRSDLGKQNIFSLSPSKLKELIKLMPDSDIKRIKYVMYTAGTYPDVDNGIQVQALTISTVAKMLPPRVKHHLTTMPPKDLNKTRILRDIGLQTLAYDIEVYDKNLFKFFCPGKQKLYGQENMFKAIEEGVKVFGYTNLKVGFVGGLEPISSMKLGMQRFASVGAGISINVFHPDSKTELENYSRPTPEYLIDMVRIQRDLYKQYNLIPVFPNGGRRSSLDSEVYRGFFNEI